MIVDTRSPQGSAFQVMGLVGALLKQTGRNDEWPAIRERMMSGDYANLCAIATEVSFGSIEFTDDADEDDEDYL